MSKISIIVPVYNVEKYIDECVQSLVNQTYTNLEIILVDDGSTDTSGHKCDVWAAKDDRIKAIHQKNSGGARGGVITGVKISTGDYIAFLDSDDWFVPHAMETLLETIAEHSADCVQFEYLHFINGSAEKHSHQQFEILTADAIRQQALANLFATGLHKNTQWNYGRTDKLYHGDIVRSIIDELNPAITIYEDMDMNFHIANKCQKAVIVPDCHFYCWRHIGGSISKRMIDKTIDEHIRFLDEMEKFAYENGFDCSGVKKFRDSVYVDLMVMALFNKLSLSKKREYLRRLISLMNDKKHISLFADNHAFITRNALKYLAHFDTFIPGILSQLYLRIKK